jgi:hypothetical protein
LRSAQPNFAALNPKQYFDKPVAYQVWQWKLAGENRMGGFYGGIHILNPERESIVAALQSLATKNERFLISASNGKWVSVYPNNHGQDERSLALCSPTSTVTSEITRRYFRFSPAKNSGRRFC